MNMFLPTSLETRLRLQVLLQKIKTNLVNHSGYLAKEFLQAPLSDRSVSWPGVRVFQFMNRCLQQGRLLASKAIDECQEFLC